MMPCPMGPKAPRSTVLSSEEEAIIIAFRKHTLLPLDDCIYALQATIPLVYSVVAASVLQAPRNELATRSPATRRPRSPSNAVRLATSTSTSPRFAPRTANKWCSRFNARGRAAGHPVRQRCHQESLLPKRFYPRRHKIENYFCRIKDWRRIAARYDKLGRNFLAATAPPRCSLLDQVVSPDPDRIFTESE